MPKRIPSAVIKKWGQLKHDFISSIDGLKEKGIVTKDYKKDIKKKVEALYTEFDAGLSSKLKKASTTKSDEEAVTEINKAKGVATTYLATVNKRKTEWGVDLVAVANKFKRALEDIIAACDEALAAT